MPSKIFDRKVLLITGGTGSFGKEFLKFILDNYKPKKVIIFSRDEYKQYLLRKKYPETKYPSIRFFIGDIRDPCRLNVAFKGVDYVVHAAALKHVNAAEYNPYEYVQTNIIGAENITRVSMENGVKKVIALSTDKASNPINLYGATKLASDKIFIASNQFYSPKKIQFSVVRYGNVAGSRGSVIPFFIELVRNKKKNIPITDKKMTRFFITLNEAVKFVVKCFETMTGGEIFIPKISSIRIIELANIIAPKINKKIIGIRPGEKIHETLITEEENNVYEYKYGYIIAPSFNNNRFKKPKYKKIDGLEISSDDNNFIEGEKRIKELIDKAMLELQD